MIAAIIRAPAAAASVLPGGLAVTGDVELRAQGTDDRPAGSRRERTANISEEPPAGCSAPGTNARRFLRSRGTTTRRLLRSRRNTLPSPTARAFHIGSRVRAGGVCRGTSSPGSRLPLGDGLELACLRVEGLELARGRIDDREGAGPGLADDARRDGVGRSRAAGGPE